MTTGKWAAAGVFACVLLWSGPLGAQQPGLPESMTKPSIDMPTIKSQLRLGHQIGMVCLQELKTSPMDDSVPLAASTNRACLDTYRLVRAGREGLELKRDRQKIPDPVLDYAFKQLTVAWNLSRTPADRLSWSMPRAQYLAISIRDMGQALRALDQVMVVLP